MSRFLPRGAPEPTKTASKPPSVEQRLEALDRRRVFDLDAAHLEDVAALLVEHFGRQAERRNVGAHQAARTIELLEDRHRVAERRQIVGDGERRRAGADERDALAVLLRRRLGQHLRDVIAIVGGDALEAADGDGLAVDASAPAGRLARTIARAPEDAGEHVRLAVEEIRFGEAPLRDQSNVLGDVGVRRARPLAIDYLVVVARIRDVRRLHRSLRRRAKNPAYTNGDGGLRPRLIVSERCTQDVARHDGTVVTPSTAIAIRYPA